LVSRPVQVEASFLRWEDNQTVTVTVATINLVTPPAPPPPGDGGDDGGGGPCDGAVLVMPDADSSLMPIC
jgi:hypothetical protein